MIAAQSLNAVATAVVCLSVALLFKKVNYTHVPNYYACIHTRMCLCIFFELHVSACMFLHECVCEYLCVCELSFVCACVCMCVRVFDLMCIKDGGIGEED